MRIYSYCSYDGSPCGFQIGYCDTAEKIAELQGESVTPLVRKAFECGYIDFMCGYNLEQVQANQYLIVIKKLEYQKGKIRYYLNFAFEMDSAEVYFSLLSGILQQYENIPEFSRIIAEMIIIQKDDGNFGLTLNMNAVRQFLNIVGTSGILPKSYHYLNAEQQLFFFRKILPDSENKNRSKEIMQAFSFDSSVNLTHDAQKHCHIAKIGTGKAILKSKMSQVLQLFINRKENSKL